MNISRSEKLMLLKSRQQELLNLISVYENAVSERQKVIENCQEISTEVNAECCFSKVDNQLREIEKVKTGASVNLGSTPSIKKYRCEEKGCRYSTSLKTYLIRHNRVHSDFRPFRCCYKDCQYAAKQKRHLEDHVWTHFDARRFQCDVAGCNYQVNRRDSLKKHLRKHKGNSVDTFLGNTEEEKEEIKKKIKISKPPKYKCNHQGCNYSSTTFVLLSLHQIRHSQFMRFRCAFQGCRYACKRKQQLQRHAWIHFDVKRYQCQVPGCEYRARLRNSVKVHMRKHHKISNYLISF